jgi:anti-sigma-K factor RskA
VTCAEFKENVAALALGALDPAEKAACEAHLASEGRHDGCEAELARASETAALLAATLPPVRPRPQTWQRIEAELPSRDAASSPSDRARAAVASAQGGEAGARRPPGRRTGSRAGGWREGAAWGLAVAAAAVAFVMGVERRNAERRLGEAEREIARAESVDLQKQACLNELASARIALRQKAAAISLIEDPRTRLVQLAAEAGMPYRASAIVNPVLPNAMVLASSLPPQPGKDYQLWLIRGQEKISAGILQTGATGATIATVPREILAGGAPDAFAVTIEPAGGVPQPTGPIVLVGKLPQT